MLRKLLLVIVITVLVSILILVAKFTAHSKITGRVRLQGLHGPVSVYRDRYGIPHIDAKSSDADAYFALGYVQAQDRLWQMVFQKHVVQGTLSEIFGKKTLKEDEYLRTWGFYRAAKQAWPALNAATKKVVEAYTAGINAYLHKGDYPMQFHMLSYQPKRWTVIDSIAWQKMMAWDLQNAWQDKIKNYLLLKHYSLYGINYFRPPYPKDGPVVLSHNDLTQAKLSIRDIARQKPITHLLADLQGLQSQLAFSTQVRHQLGFADMPSKGSNNWVVSGRLTQSGKPLLADDPHLALQAPSIWYLAELRGPHLHVYGATVPGLPGVIIGRNDHIAWAVTNGNPDTQDLYILSKHATVKTIIEKIKIRGHATVKYPVHISQYGPIISDVDPHVQSTGLRIAIKWTALQPGDTTVQSFAELATAANWHDFVDALKSYVAPTQNFLYADTNGNIGYYYPGKIPIRNGWLGNLPVTSDKDHQWMGYIPFRDLPHVYNPVEGYIITANNKVVDNTYPYQLTFRWRTMPFRAERIKQLLLSQGKLTEAKFRNIQLDTHSGFWLLLRPVLLNTKPLDTPSKIGLGLLQRWNGNMTQSSTATTIFQYWIRTLAMHLTPKDIRFGNRWLEPYFLKHVLQEPREQQLLSKTLQQAMKALISDYGQNEANWRWGSMHKAVFNELGMGKAKSVAWIWRRKISTPGGDYTVNAAPFDPKTWQQTGGATYRQIIDLSDMNNSEFISTLGQSESPISNNYSDMMAMWRNGQYIKMRNLSQFCDQHPTHCLTLMPKHMQ